MKLEWYIARRYLARHSGGRYLPLATLLSMAGVAVGVMALITVTAVMTGLQREIRSRILLASPPLEIRPATGERMEGWEQLLPVIRQAAGTREVAPFVQTDVGLRNRTGNVHGAMLRGIDPGAAAPGAPAQVWRPEHAGPTRSGHPPLLVGTGVARSLGLFEGDVVTVASLQGMRVDPLGNLVPRLARFEVVGLFSTGLFEKDAGLAFTTLAAAREVAGLGAPVSGIEVQGIDPERTGEVGERIVAALGPGYRHEDWSTANESLLEALKLEKLAMRLILSLIVVVAAFSIASTLVMLVTTKTREIGILKAMGLTTPQVQRVFQLQGLSIGLVGALLGLAGGLLLTWLQDRYHLVRMAPEAYFIDHLPVLVDGWDVAWIVLSSVVVAVLVTIYPAYRAARLLPIEAISHE